MTVASPPDAPALPAVVCSRCERHGPEADTAFMAQRAARAARWTSTTVPDGPVRRPVFTCPACAPSHCACGAIYTPEAWAALPEVGAGTVVDGRHLVWRRCVGLRPDGAVCASTVTREVPRGR